MQDEIKVIQEKFNNLELADQLRLIAEIAKELMRVESTSILTPCNIHKEDTKQRKLRIGKS